MESAIVRHIFLGFHEQIPGVGFAGNPSRCNFSQVQSSICDIIEVQQGPEMWFYVANNLGDSCH